MLFVVLVLKLILNCDGFVTPQPRCSAARRSCCGEELVPSAEHSHQSSVKVDRWTVQLALPGVRDLIRHEPF